MTTQLATIDEGFYASAEECRADFSPDEFVMLCDAVKVVADSNPTLLLMRKKAHSEVTSNLTTIYESVGEMPAKLPGKISALLITAELAYLRFFLWSRKPAAAAKVNPDGSYLRDLWKFAEGRMDRIKDSVQEIAPDDNPPPGPPANVGGTTVDNGPKMLGDAGCGKMDIGDY